MNLIHDTVKIKLVEEGYLPNYPYHLISDAEMCDAFLNGDSSYFYAAYPCLDDSLEDAYNELVSAIKGHLDALKDTTNNITRLPDWVYTYMLGSTISVNSDKRDIHDLLVPLGVDNIDDEFTAKASISCYEVSTAWVKKLIGAQERPPTMFGEPHVVKSLRIQQFNLS